MNQYDDLPKFQSLLLAVNFDYRENIHQNSVILTHATQGQREARELMEMLGPTHPGYQKARSLMNRFQAQEKAEFDEDVRHKGLIAMLEDCLGPLNRLLRLLQGISPNVDELTGKLNRVMEELRK